MLHKKNLNDDARERRLDAILKEASEGYGDLVAAAAIHGVSQKALRARLSEVERRRGLHGSRNGAM